MVRRNPYDIRADMLILCRVPRIKTKIVYKCNMNFNNVRTYIKILIGEGHLMIISGKRTLYQSTKAGLEWANDAGEIGIGTLYERDIASTFL